MSQKEEMHVPEEYAASASTHNGPVLGILVIILALILGGLYLWGSMLSTGPTLVPEETITNEEADAPEEETTTNFISPSDELDAIEADIETTGIESVDADVEAMDTEMEAATSE